MREKVFGKSHSLENSLRESIFREDLFLYNCLQFVYCVGKLGAAASFALVWLITIELYPTNLRTQAIGTCSSIARVFGLGCPFVANLAVYWKPLPMLVSCSLYLIIESDFIYENIKIVPF